ncbi:MAG: restriction endonuclease subunit S [Proteobacteria bacterium]|nr:restriction endonuclease subunit S [Pseudomonadota bacterium]
MEVRPGYKQTEVGVIPEDWDVKPLGELGQFKNGINKGKEDFGYGFPFVNLMDIFGIPKISSEANFGLVDSSPAERKLYELRGGDVLFVRSSVKPEGVGLTALVPEDLPDTVFSGFLIRFRDQGQFALEFKEHCFWETGFRSRIIANSTVSANTNINQNALKAIQIAFPPKKDEQRAIAGALGDVDALIGSLEKLIAKKRDLKQAAMQQLLTGQKRLPGFSGEWEVKKLGEVVEIVSGGTPKTSVPTYWDGDIKWCTPTDITGTAGKYLSETERTISALGLASCSARLLPAGALLLCSRATIGEVKIAAGAVCTNQGFKSLICGKNVNNEFLYYLLLTMKAQMVEKAIGSTFLEISKKDSFLLEILLPPLPEQTAIATVLSDMDAEIAALEQRLAKTRDLKQGMMQELLTGKTRLV